MTIDKYKSDDVYQNLSETIEAQNARFNHTWTLYLLLCCFTASLASFQFGYNIGVVNQITPIVKEYFEKSYFKELYFDKLIELKNGEELFNNKTSIYNEKKAEFDKKERMLLEAEERRDTYLDIMSGIDQDKIREAKEYKAKREKEIREKYNTTAEKFLDEARIKIDDGKIKLQEAQQKLSEASFKISDGKRRLAEGRVKLDILNDVMWAAFNSLFIIGGMIGAFTSKHVTDRFGYKNGILFHYVFTFIGALLAFIPFYTNTPKLACILVKASRLMYGIQGGMSCTLIPSYLHEISPAGLKTKTGIFHSAFLAFGILISQLLGLKQILGCDHLWHILLAFPIFPAIISLILLVVMLPDTPRSLMDNNLEDQAKFLLMKLRGCKQVNGEIQKLHTEINESHDDDKLRFSDLFTNKNYRWPILFCILLQVAQHLFGINIIFFYSSILFEHAGLSQEYIPYAIVATGVVYFLATIVILPFVHSFRRKGLLIFTTILVIIDLLLLIALMQLQKQNEIFAYLSVVCVLFGLILFSAGLGPLPFILVEECFEKDARSSPMFICIVTNWVSALVVVLDFPFLIQILNGYTFVISVVVLAILLILVFTKMPETKNRSSKEIQNDFISSD